jgi:Domain of unknown function (DUF5658)
VKSSTTPIVTRLKGREEIRRGYDRRRRPTPRLSRHSFLGGRRGLVRRWEEIEGSFLDLYGTRLLLILMWIVLLNVGDTFFTLVHLQDGGRELNPVAELLLHSGRAGFVLWKSALISAALVVLCVHKNFYLARLGLWAAAASYTILMGYHLALFYV